MIPQPNKMPKSTYKLFTYLKKVTSMGDEIKHHYCKKCHYYYPDSKSKRPQKCIACGEKLEVSDFFTFDIEKQSKYLFEDEKIYCFLKNPSIQDSQKEDISDITESTEYNRANFSNQYSRQKFDLTLITNTDGLKLKKRSLISCWPLMFTIAEIDEKHRNHFLIISGIWCDEKKPDMNTFLRPFCKSVHLLFTEGFSWFHQKENKQYRSRVIAPLFILDAPARAYVHNRHNFKGKFGCDLCEIKTTKSTPVEGQKGFRYYHFDPDVTYRTHSRMIKQGMKTASKLDKTVKGLKGRCVVASLPRIDLSTSTIPEYMHSVLLGVVKQFLELWLQKKNCGSRI